MRARSLDFAFQEAARLQPGERLVEPVRVRRYRATVTQLDKNLLLRGRERAAGRLELKEIGAAVFDEAQIRRAPNNAEAFENFRLGWSPIATVGDVKPKRVRRGARLKVPNDGAEGGAESWLPPIAP